MHSERYQTKNKIRIVTAASLFDGHDAAINIMRRILQSSGAEVIHLGHDRSAQEVANAAIQEDANAIALTSYQGGHVEYFKYLYDLLKAEGREDIQIVGGGGGVILPDEIKILQDYGVARIYSPDDGRDMGLQGMVDDVLKLSDYPVAGQLTSKQVELLSQADHKTIAKFISTAETVADSERTEETKSVFAAVAKLAKQHPTPVLGITGTGGAGKSSVVDELIQRFLLASDTQTIAIVSVDPSKRKTGGALLGDRIRMNSINSPRVYMRSVATRQSNLALSGSVGSILDILKAANFDLIVLETSGIGQSDSEIVDCSDVSLYVMTPEFGAATQLEKIDMLDYADIVAINKSDKPGAQDAIRDVIKQFKRNRGLFEEDDNNIPVVGTIASQFNNRGITDLFNQIIKSLREKTASQIGGSINVESQASSDTATKVIPAKRVRYLSEICEALQGYDHYARDQSEIAQSLYSIDQTILALKSSDQKGDASLLDKLKQLNSETASRLDSANLALLEGWKQKMERYKQDEYKFKVRDAELTLSTHHRSLSNLSIPRVSFPNYKAWGEILAWSLQENVPGEFPYTAGLFPFKREGEEPTRMFAGEGAPERTNRRFHYLSKDNPAKRLSTAFDSVTLYGHDPDLRPDIYGKVGNAGVSVCCLDDAKKLYSGFDLADPNTSVSMTINGPAPVILAFFMNAAIDQQCEKHIKQNGLEGRVRQKIKEIYKDSESPRYQGDLPEGNDGLGLMLLGVTGDQVLEPEAYQHIKLETLTKVRGTVQADILKEDQAQNTCIFSTEFALKLMGDVQQYFIDHSVRNFYSVSVSGYHIAEAGANPITQLAFTLANGFTYVEYFLSRGMDINDFGPNLSFFFSNGIDPEYAVIGRVARRIWAKAMKLKYGAGERAQMLKYHIQTSGRSLHAQEVEFNDIRTTLQALYAIYDNCNSLHTNAYDEAITTPTEESVRRAMAIQLIINRELGLTKNENPMQGSFVIEELTNLVEEAVLLEFERISERGGVLGAMETMYQRSKIQEESMYYESLKQSGELPIIGVNTYKSAQGSKTITPKEVIRAFDDEKQQQVRNLEKSHQQNQAEASAQLRHLQQAAINQENMFEVMMDACKVCSLGQIVNALFEVGGRYRRNM